MFDKVIVHVTADFPDAMVAAKTPSVANLILGTNGYRHVIYSLNRVSRMSGVVAVDFGPDRKALAYGAPPKGIFHATYLNRVADWILKDLQTRRIAVDALHLHKFSVEGLIGLKIARTVKRPFLVNIWGDSDLKIIKFRPDLNRVWRTILAEAALIIPCAPWAEERFDHVFGIDRTKTLILPPIVQHQYFTPAPVFSEPRFVTLFNLDSYRRKNFEFLVRAIARIGRHTPMISLDVYGKGSPRTMFDLDQIIRTAGAERYVRLCGPLPNNGFSEVLNNYVAFLMPSRRETFGMVFIEALFSGLPLLYTKGWGIDGFFNADDIGYACEATQLDDVQHGVEHLLKNQERLKRSIESLHERGGLEPFTRDRIVGAYRSGLERVLSGAAHSPQCFEQGSPSHVDAIDAAPRSEFG
jgi:glycosyltransferase involved in cell wall biosynthesis